MTNPSDVLDMPVDPNEPTYCLCHQVSYGEMIGCDNPDVSTCNLEIQMLEVFFASSELKFLYFNSKMFIRSVGSKKCVFTLFIQIGCQNIQDKYHPHRKKI